MGARHRLNRLFLAGALVIAGVIGAAAESWTVFLIAAAVIVAIFVQGGDIRFTPQSPPRRRGRGRRPR